MLIHLLIKANVDYEKLLTVVRSPNELTITIRPLCQRYSICAECLRLCNVCCLVCHEDFAELMSLKCN